MQTPSRLYIDNKYIGYVKRYYKNCLTRIARWVFVLDTYDTKNEIYQMQVEIPIRNIKFFSSCPDLRIHTKEAANDRTNF